MTERIANNFDVRINKPIDIRYTIEKLTEQVDISVRYLGLIFYVADIKQVYIYSESITQPTLFTDYINSSNNNGSVLTDYSKIGDVLNKNISIGKLFTIFPLNVTYIFNGTEWVYFDGNYEVETVAIFNTIPKEFVGEKVVVNIANPKSTKITLANGNLSDEIIPIGDSLPILINHRFYSKNGNLYYCIDGVLFIVGSRESVLINYDIKIGINNVVHNLKSKNLSITLLSDVLESITQITYYQAVNDNSFNFESYCDIERATLIIKTI